MNEERKISRSGDRSLQTTRPNELILDIVSRKPTTLALYDNPDVYHALDVVYWNPGTMDIDNNKPAPTLEFLRANFPDTIETFDENRMTEILSKNAVSSTRVLEQQTQLSEIPNQPKVSSIEIALKIMHDDSDIRNFDPIRASEIRGSSRLYTSLIDSLSPQLSEIRTHDETKLLLGLGQDLLRIVNLTEPQITEYNPFHPVRSDNVESDFRGKLAQIKFLNILIASLTTAKASNIEIAGLKQDHKRLVDDLRQAHPNRFTEIKQILGVHDSRMSVRAWSEIPGEPQLTTAERFDRQL